MVRLEVARRDVMAVLNRAVPPGMVPVVVAREMAHLMPLMPEFVWTVPPTICGLCRRRCGERKDSPGCNQNGFHCIDTVFHLRLHEMGWWASARCPC